MTFSSSFIVYPCLNPRPNIAASVAIRSATNGSPRNSKIGATPARAGTTPQMESRMISTNGIRIIPTIIPKLGSLDSSISSWFATLSGTGTKYFFPQMDPHTGPATIIAKIPQKIPTKMTQPRSTFSIVATRTGPGVGGMNACPTASPARSGIT